MKKKPLFWILILCVTLVATLLVLLVRENLKTFEALSSIDVNKRPYPLPAKYIRAQNLKTGSTDTIYFKEQMLINFWASWCKPCIAEFPSLQEFKRANPGIQVLLLSFDSIQKLKTVLDSKRIDIDAYFISDTVLFKYPEALPKTYLIRDSIVLKEMYGQKNWMDTANTAVFSSRR